MKLQVFGFAFIVVAAVAGADYSMQARQSDHSLGFGGYIDSITGRYQATVEGYALKARQKQEAKIHLPEAPEGWTRREWIEADTTRIEVDGSKMSGWEKRNLSVFELSAMMGGMVETDVSLAARMQRKEIWVYENADEIIALRVVYAKTGAPKKFPGMDNKIDAANLEAVKIAAPYAVLEDVAFGEVQPNLKGAAPISYRTFSAKMGHNVMIGVRANASDASILKLLGMVDYGGLNGMLELPTEDTVEGTEQGLAEAVPEPLEAPSQQQETVGEVAQVETDLVAEEPTKAIGVGLAKVRHMPGQKCQRKTGSSFCSNLTN